MMRFPSVDRTATIAISMKVDGPGTIGLQHPARTFLTFAMQSRPLAGGGKKPQAACCRFKIEAASSSPVFGQT
jgi:hypothetical protein